MRSLVPCKRKIAASIPVAAHAAKLIHGGSLKSNTANASRRKLAAYRQVEDVLGATAKHDRSDEAPATHRATK